MLNFACTRFLKKKFRSADKNNSNSLTFSETKDLVKVGLFYILSCAFLIILYFQLLNIKISKEELETKFNQANTEKGNVGKEVREKN